ncbi:hypothetical protein ASF73_13840 [Xanthomonas sp. Leaf131]|nr:hypothetical protein ASF73_13840 [Xanthomonas sp. Leaf131]
MQRAGQTVALRRGSMFAQDAAPVVCLQPIAMTLRAVRTWQQAWSAPISSESVRRSIRRAGDGALP